MNTSKQFLGRMSRGLRKSATIPNFLTKKNKNSSIPCKAMVNKKQPEANVVAVDIKDVNRDGLTLLAKVSVTNPYVVSIPICDINFSLKSAGREIAKGKVPDPGFLKANDNTMLDVPVRVPYSVLVSLVQDIAADWDIDYVLDLGLVIDVPLLGNITIPLSYKGQLNLPQFSDFFK